MVGADVARVQGVWRRLVLAVAGAIAVAFAPAALAASPEEDLVDAYAPVVRVQTQEEPCAEGEPYHPLDVDVLFGNVEVAFRGPWDTVNLVKVAPVGPAPTMITSASITGHSPRSLSSTTAHASRDSHFRRFWLRPVTGLAVEVPEAIRPYASLCCGSVPSRSTLW